MKKLSIDMDLGRKVKSDNRRKIAPVSFPPIINRDHFGSWLSGFVDGEGCFQLSSAWKKNSFHAGVRFQINLRADDVETLLLIQAYLSCGYVYHAKKGKIGEDTCMFYVDKKRELNDVLVPHFRTYPLLAKKKNDFAIWSQGVAFCVEVMNRPWRSRVGFSGGRLPAWEKEDIMEFEMLVAMLKDERKYRSPTQITENEERA